MPAVIEALADGAGIIVTQTRGCDKGLLCGASVVIPDGNPGAGDIWVEIGVLSDGSSTYSVSAVLASGYVSRSRPLIWQGMISMSPGNAFYMRSISLVINTIRATFRIGEG